MRLEFDAHQRAARQVLLDHMQGHVAPAQAGAQEGVLGAEIGQAPHARRQHAEVAAPGQARAVGEHQLHVVLRAL